MSLFCLNCAFSSAYGIYVFLDDILGAGDTNAPTHGNPLLPINWVVLCVVGTALGLAVSAFTMYSFYLTVKNITVIETLEPIKYKTGLPASAYIYSEPPSSKMWKFV